MIDLKMVDGANCPITVTKPLIYSSSDSPLKHWFQCHTQRTEFWLNVCFFALSRSWPHNSQAVMISYLIKQILDKDKIWEISFVSLRCLIENQCWFSECTHDHGFCACILYSFLENGSSEDERSILFFSPNPALTGMPMYSTVFMGLSDI